MSLANPQPATSHPPRVTRSEVIAKCDYFTRVHLWPLRSSLDPEAWLRNFTPAEQDHAVHLLNAFMYFHHNLVHEMFASAIQSLSRKVLAPQTSLITAQYGWSQFLSSALIVPVSGEIGNPSDSGYAFARIARQHVGFLEDQIVSAIDALSMLAAGPRPVIFVDDFAGTGNQFINTWERLIRSGLGAETSFSAIAGIRGMRFFYCPVLCTQKAFNEIELMCPAVTLQPAHILTDRYSAVSPDSAIWPSHLKDSAFDFLNAASLRAGIPDTDGASPDDWQGYEKQGLVLALHETIPDSTLCMLRWNKNSWNPLMVKA
jgi:hypothetical protein